MSEAGLIIENFKFDTKRDYHQANKEAEAIMYIQTKTDLTDIKMVFKVYTKLIDKKIFHTVVGYCFLLNLRTLILESNQYKLDEVKVIPIIEQISPDNMNRNITDEEKRIKENAVLLGTYKTKNINLKIITFFLSFIIVVILLLSYQGKQGVFADYENQVLNKYATWKEQLESKEKELDQREVMIQEKEND